MQWEYKVINSKIKSKGFVSPEPDANNLEASLNELGRQNWELISCILPPIGAVNGSHIQAILKRPK